MASTPKQEDGETREEGVPYMVTMTIADWCHPSAQGDLPLRNPTVKDQQQICY